MTLMRAEPCNLYAPQDFFPKMFPPTNIFSQMCEKGLTFQHRNWTETPPSIFLKNKIIQKTAKLDATSTINCYCLLNSTFPL